MIPFILSCLSLGIQEYTIRNYVIFHWKTFIHSFGILKIDESIIKQITRNQEMYSAIVEFINFILHLDSSYTINNSEYIFGSLSQIFFYYSLDELNISSENIFNFTLDIIKSYFSSDYEYYNETIKNAGILIAALVNIESNKNLKFQYLNLFCNFLIEQLNHGDSKRKVNIFNIFSILVKQIKIPIFDLNNFPSFITTILNTILNHESINVSQSAINFIIRIAQNQKYKCLLNPDMCNNILTILIELLHEMQLLTQPELIFKEIIIGAICSLSQLQSYDNSSSLQIISIILPYLPLKYEKQLFKKVYFFLNTNQRNIENNPELLFKLLSIYIYIISDQNNEEQYINDQLLLPLIGYFTFEKLKLLSSEERTNIIYSILGNNENMITSFQNRLTQLHSTGESIAFPQLNLTDFNNIDPTNLEEIPEEDKNFDINDILIDDN